MNILESIILGIIQGITEWLPISSSGHLVLFQNLFGIEQPLVFDVALHFGSLIVIFIVFWKDILTIAEGVLKREKKYLNIFLMLVIATIPIGLIGYFLKDFISSIFNNLAAVGFALLFTALLLFLSRFPKKKDKELGFKNTFIMGIAQGIAILPGVSRSGSTISLGLMQGVKQEEAARFSFLMAIPAILGASVLEFKNLGQIDSITNLLLGMSFAILAGIFTLKLLLKIIKSNKFSYFAIYCLILGLIVLSKVYLKW